MKTLRFEGSDPSSSFNQRTLQKGLGCNGGSYKLQLQLQSGLLQLQLFQVQADLSGSVSLGILILIMALRAE